ncbi:MAG: ATP phosphoribosyltransferase regulatory subunit [Clostridium sp.]|nr:ATP phosphoribosyltransferase regulatory subunit [Clostridium sp.]
MAEWKIYTPEGIQDVLINECFFKRNLEQRVRKVFRSSGYYEVETPTVEFYDVFSTEENIIPQETMFKFFDQQGRILVLRPDITIPIARVAATKYRDNRYPLRMSYIGNAFKYNELGGGKQKEFTQAGVEIIGAKTPQADAEVIATAIDAVKATGLKNFQIDIGQVEFFKGLMEETGLSDAETEKMRVLIDKKDFLGIEELVKKHNIKDGLKDLILDLPKLFGSIDIIDKVEKYPINKRSIDALNNLRSIIKMLDDYGLCKYVSIDLGMVQSLNYYSGTIFRGFTYGVGFPILSGGRYDGLVEKFGRKSPATGFSMGINMVMMALERQNIEIEKPEIDTLVFCEEGGRGTAFRICQALRSQEIVVEMDINGEGFEMARSYAVSKEIGGILRVIDDENIELHNLEENKISKVSMGELLNA